MASAPALMNTALLNTAASLDPRQDKLIVLKSCYGKTNHKLRLEPAKDVRTGRWLGVQILSEEQKRNTPYVVTPGESFLEIRDGHVFDLKNFKDALDWEWVRHCPQIGTSRDATNFKLDGEAYISFEGSDTEFYVYDEEAEVLGQEKKFNNQFEALKFIYEQSPTQLYQVARLLGSNMEGTKVSGVRNFLISKAQKHPEAILKVEQDPYAKTRLFFFAALDKEIIRKRAGVFYYQETAIGATEEQALLWLREDRNHVLVRAISLELTPAPTERVPSGSPANEAVFTQAVDFRASTFSAPADSLTDLPDALSLSPLPAPVEDELFDMNDDVVPEAPQPPLPRAQTRRQQR